MNSYSKSLDFNFIKFDKIELLSKYFQKPLPNFANSNKDPQELIEIFYTFLHEQRKKARKAIQLALKLKALSESYLEEIKSYRFMQETAEYRLEQYNTQIEDYEKDQAKKAQKIEEQHKDIEDLEKNIHDLSQERENLKKEIQNLKKNIKQQESTNEQMNALEKKKFLKEKEDNIKKFELLRSELIHKEKSIDQKTQLIEKLEFLLNQEKSLTEKFRNDINRYKSEIMELKNQLDEAKLKKSNYKDLFKELQDQNASRSNLKNNSTQTSTQYPSDTEDDKSEEKSSVHENHSELNDLINLEEEQSLAFNEIINSVSVNENFSLNESNNSLNNRDSMIYIMSPRAQVPINEEKFEIQNCDKILIEPIKKQTETHSAKKIVPKIIRIKGKDGRVLMRVKSPTYEFPIQKNNMKMCFSTSVTPKSQMLSMETWTDSITTVLSKNDTEATSIDIEKPARENYEDDVCRVDEQSENKTGDKVKIYTDPVKEYFVKVCQEVKASCKYTDKISRIPMSMLFENLVRLQVPYCKWPDTVEEYIIKRLKQK
ncbi:hypothetical protein SteCoe_27739 [Stentor coeruleus]|uniref:Uncharacterized protein n=1 Tax=Stentor coeruleus TaxID=5963 RepID=A0A1R2B9V7_9CILI|nr:hypothetical protein SteCoe_27739 [Stentor coeruleus]